MRGLCVWLMFEVQIQPLDVQNWFYILCHRSFLSTWSCFRMRCKNGAIMFEIGIEELMLKKSEKEVDR